VFGIYRFGSVTT